MLALKNVKIQYGDKTIIENFNMTVGRGFTVLAGPSGSGKTSIMNAILGLIEYDGSITKDSDNFSAVFQENRLMENTTVYKNLRMVCHDKDTIIKALSDLNMADTKDNLVSTLSGGMQRRIAIIRSQLVDYDTLILDEPFKGLDEQTKLLTMNYIKEKASEKSVLLITHDLSEAKYFNAKSIVQINL